MLAVPRSLSAKSVYRWSRVLRVHQWTKNLLVFVPLLAAHNISQPTTVLRATVAFFLFSLVASAGYIVNDLFDLEQDRAHPTKRNRPIAAGLIPLKQALVASALFALAALAIAFLVDNRLFLILLLYLLVTGAYSWLLRKIALIDCAVLTLFYMLRIIGGGVTAGVTLSFWLLGFSLFTFMSLAFLKRFTELILIQNSQIEHKNGRGYVPDDAPLIQVVGVSSGTASVVLLALYLNSDAVVVLYRTPELLWPCIPLMMLWISWTWIKAHRGEMDSDPVLFALTDRASLAFVLTCLGLGILATVV